MRPSTCRPPCQAAALLAPPRQRVHLRLTPLAPRLALWRYLELDFNRGGRGGLRRSSRPRLCQVTPWALRALSQAPAPARRRCSEPPCGPRLCQVPRPEQVSRLGIAPVSDSAARATRLDPHVWRRCRRQSLTALVELHYMGPRSGSYNQNKVHRPQAASTADHENRCFSHLSPRLLPPPPRSFRIMHH